MKTPFSTYRIQFNKDFTFKDFEKVKTYFEKLGVHTIYASPIFEAVPGSTHGYDVCNPNIVNPEIGDEAQLLGLNRWLKEKRMLWIQDIVPNHMAFHTKNEWLTDLLEKGNKSLFTSYFDSVFTCLSMNGKLMVPFLGLSLEDAVSSSELILKWDSERVVLCYNNNPFPINPSSYSFFLERLKLNKLVQEVEKLESITSKEAYANKWEQILSEIKKAFSENEAYKLRSVLEAFNENKSLLTDLIHAQNYELCHWEETNHRINYRRFFTVNGLICVNIADEKVFDNHHRFTKQMVDLGVFDGLRIDHIDGLFDPSEYLRRLRNLAGKETYIVAEKILERGEETPVAWPIQGNTGYDFLGMVNNLFTNKSSEKEFNDFYGGINHGKAIADDELAKKRYILENHLAGELENLYVFFTKLQLSNEPLDKKNLKQAIAAFLINMPVYRFYSETFPLNFSDQKAVKRIFEKIKADGSVFQKELEVLEEIFLQASPTTNETRNKAIASFFKRCMQFSGPIMAKGVEDTLMYTNFRFIGHNEVGDHPASFGLSIKEFHELMAKQQKRNPLSLNTTSTHDTKRGEDTRARLNVLTTLPSEWFAKVKHWQDINSSKRNEFKMELHAEYFIYQCLLGHYPIANEEKEAFGSRLKSYLQKAFREGKEHSDWANVNKDFEENIFGYVDELLNPENAFFQDFKVYHEKIALYGAHNSLAQLGLKFTSPGIPDVYQGGELWDFSFVDPDNRSKVDYILRAQELENIEHSEINDLMANYSTGRIKLWLTHQLFKLRKEESLIFQFGNYIPVEVNGRYKNNIIAFIRRVQRQSLLVIAVVNSAQMLENQNISFESLDWEDTKITLAEESNWFNILQKNEGNGKQILLNDLSLKLPFAVFKLTDSRNRSAGILMHISSLPSEFGIGDLGPEAFRFVDFLKLSGQRYWQVLPLGPGASEHDISPYSTLCSMATNPLFISPETLMRDGYLNEIDLQEFRGSSERIDYPNATEVKLKLLKKAFLNFRQVNSTDELFQKFIVEEKDWLADYSRFMVFRSKFDKQWFQWPDEYKLRETNALIKFSNDYSEEILEQQWYQYIFHTQWEDLKTYCSQNQIHLIGDLPFYVNHDSSDVWANPKLFALNEYGFIDKMAGVPPDYFSPDGQLWGMPVYNWLAMEQNGYRWWLNRIRKNLSLFDLLRLDHFRAFYDYWEVDGNEITAINGGWKLGPAIEFLNKVRAEIPQMPFIAEDLGEISDEVFNLRDAFSLPGMKVLQFAFYDDMQLSPHIPHQHSSNFIVYTGTHDNNTTKGWFGNELSLEDKERLNGYLGKTANENNVSELLIKMAYASVAKIAIIPIQDILNLDEVYRTNIPGTSIGNWNFRISKDYWSEVKVGKLKDLVVKYGRG